MKHVAPAFAFQRFTGLAALVALTLSLTPPEPVRAGGCASFRHYTSGFAAPAGTSLPADGGVLFVPTVVNGTSGEGNTFTRANGQPLESLRRGTALLASTRVELAPGWVILHPTTPTHGRVTGVAGGSRRAFSMARAAAPPALAAAQSPSVQYVPPQQQQTPIGVRMSSAYNQLTLARRPPAGAYAVVVRGSFAIPIDDAQQRTFVFSSDAGRCQPMRPGNVVGTNTDVEVLFVDIHGRTSEPVATRVR